MRELIDEFKIGYKKGWKLFWSPFVEFADALLKYWHASFNRR